MRLNVEGLGERQNPKFQAIKPSFESYIVSRSFETRTTGPYQNFEPWKPVAKLKFIRPL